MCIAAPSPPASLDLLLRQVRTQQAGGCATRSPTVASCSAGSLLAVVGPHSKRRRYFLEGLLPSSWGKRWGMRSPSAGREDYMMNPAMTSRPPAPTRHPPLLVLQPTPRTLWLLRVLVCGGSSLITSCRESCRTLNSRIVTAARWRSMCSSDGITAVVVATSTGEYMIGFRERP